ncbi:hypothetical protein [Bosea sp. FBZP-16]|uniref:hypothetical protein n=1 Tax=Bosea sp. FBZP-16 TaxID=2065382 RepID=UPI00131A42EA|nr:hypothetical protein [Bosea sp. FBZP-16]
MVKNKTSMRQAPQYIRNWWSRTGLEAAIQRAVEIGYSWEEAHARLSAMYTRWFDAGMRGMNPLLRLVSRVCAERAISSYRSGAEFARLVMGGVPCLTVSLGGGRWSSYLPESRFTVRS